MLKLQFDRYIRGKDRPLLLKRLERREDRYTSHDIQNEIIAIDEYTAISNKEQPTICIRWVDKELQAHEDFFGFYNVPDRRGDNSVGCKRCVIETTVII